MELFSILKMPRVSVIKNDKHSNVFGPWRDLGTLSGTSGGLWAVLETPLCLLGASLGLLGA